MKNEHMPVCPGCSRHCPANAVRCKYGRAYFTKHPPAEAACSGKQKGHKWKAFVEKNGLLWNYLLSAKEIKKALCHQKATEAALLSLLTEEEKRSLGSIAEKLRQAVEKE